MIFSWSLSVKFEVDGKSYEIMVDKLIIKDHRPERFYRVPGKGGNRDIIKHNGQWIVCSGKHIPDNILDAIGKGIEQTFEGDI